MATQYLIPSEKRLPVGDRTHAGAAWAALHTGYRGNKYSGPGKQAAISKLRGIYRSHGWKLPNESKSKWRS